MVKIYRTPQSKILATPMIATRIGLWHGHKVTPHVATQGGGVCGLWLPCVELGIRQTTPNVSAGSPVFWANDPLEICKGSPSTGRKWRWGRWKWRTFDKILDVPRKQNEIDALLLLKANRTSCAFLSNIAIVDDLEWPLTTPNHPVFYYFFTAVRIFVKREARNVDSLFMAW